MTTEPRRGRPERVIDEAKFKALCEEWTRGNLTARQVQRRMELPARTFYRMAKRRGYSRNQEAAGA